MTVSKKDWVNKVLMRGRSMIKAYEISHKYITFLHIKQLEGFYCDASVKFKMIIKDPPTTKTGQYLITILGYSLFTTLSCNN